MKPYIITHMGMSLDGRIQVRNWGKVKGVDAYEETHKLFKGNAWMVGRVTMELHFAKGKPGKLKPSKVKLDRSDFVADHKSKSYAISVDESGKLRYKSDSIDGDHLIVVLAEKVGDDYLQFLRDKGISYIFGGAKEIDFVLVMTKLVKLFSIKVLMLEGGGSINGSVLRAGLIDEISILQFPVIDGTPETPSVFDFKKGLKPSGTKLKLYSVKHLPHDVLWVRYKTVRKAR